LIGIFKLTFWGLKNAVESLWLDKAISESLSRTKWFGISIVGNYWVGKNEVADF
jgi:hypothetical protein